MFWKRDTSQTSDL